MNQAGRSTLRTEAYLGLRLGSRDYPNFGSSLRSHFSTTCSKSEDGLDIFKVWMEVKFALTVWCHSRCFDDYYECLNILQAIRLITTVLSLFEMSLRCIACMRWSRSGRTVSNGEVSPIISSIISQMSPRRLLFLQLIEFLF